MTQFNIGDRVRYSGQTSGEPPVKDTIITDIPLWWPTIFAFPVCKLKGVDHWCALHDLTLIQKDYKS